MPELDSRAPGERLTDRRRFTVQMAVALLGGAAISIGCGGGGSPTSPGPVPTPTPFAALRRWPHAARGGGVGDGSLRAVRAGAAADRRYRTSSTPASIPAT